jgi:hypothetical protein
MAALANPIPSYLYEGPTKPFAMNIRCLDSSASNVGASGPANVRRSLLYLSSYGVQ